LANGATAGDLVEVISFQVSSVLNAIPGTAGSVGTTYLANGAVTNAKIDTVAASKITGNVPGTLLKRTVQTFSGVRATTSTTYQTNDYSLSYTPLASGNTLIVFFYGTCGWVGSTNGQNYIGAIYRINCDGNFSSHLGMWIRDDGPNQKEISVQATGSLRYLTTGTSAITIRAEYRASGDQIGTATAQFNNWTDSGLSNGATQNRFEIFEYAGSVAS
jgi:hypothetical protein